LKILLIDQFGEMGGAQRCLLEAAMGFAERGWEVHALAPGAPIVNVRKWQVGDLPHHCPVGQVCDLPSSLAKALAPYCAEVRELPCGPFASAAKTVSDAVRFAWQLPRQAAKIARTVARRRIDVVYVNGPRVLPAAALGCSALGRAGRPLIYHSHWMVPQRSAASMARAALRRSGASAIATSRLAAEWLQDSIKPGLITTVYNGVAGFGISPRPRDAVRHVAILGRVSPEKGQLEFVRAARICAQRDPGLRFTVCGAPMFAESRHFEQVRAEAAGIPVDLAGWTEDVGAFLAGVDLLVVPSKPIDNIPRVILEAFAAGVPVLAFASGAIPELIQHGETGLLVHRQTPDALAESVLSAARNCDLLNQIAARAYRRWQERYTLRRFQSEISEAVEAAARRHPQRTPLASAGASAPA
jgi:glycosyltransferase involved in cell wall biosynthesis